MTDQQRSLFSLEAYGVTKPTDLSRADDPVESKQAAEQIKSSLGDLQAWAVECVKKSPGKTAMELANIVCPLDPRKIGRRLGECEKLGLIKRGDSRECSITKRRAATWVPKQ